MRRSESDGQIVVTKIQFNFQFKVTDNKIHFIINISLIYKDNEES